MARENNEEGVETIRGKWNGRIEYLITTIGYAVDLGNVFRFPYICYKNHGGAFLLPYIIMTLLVAFPMYIMEYIIGQYSQQGALTIWNMIPIIKGIGWSTMLINLIIGLYYNAIISWAMFYIYSSIFNPLPWMGCQNSWNSPNCTLISKAVDNSNFSATEYFERKLFNTHNIPDEMMKPQGELLLSLFLTYVLLYLCVFKGTKSLGKVAWFTSLMPYIVLIALFVNAFFLSGSMKGILFFITPNMKTLQNYNVWIDAASQIFFSMGLGVGVHITFASYNPRKSPILPNCVITLFVNCLTSIFSGFVVFAYLGHFNRDTDINNENGDHYGMVMILYSAVLGQFRYPQIWCILFFSMIVSLGIDSSFGAVEALLAAILDYFKNFFNKYHYSREILTGVTLIFYFIISIPLTCPAGLTLISIMDETICTVSLLLIGLIECIAIGWIYGVYQLTENLKEMTGQKIWIGFGITLKFICPAILMIILLSLFDQDPDQHQPEKLKIIEVSYTVKKSIQLIFGFAPIMLIIIFGIIEWNKYRAKGTKKQILAMLISPIDEHEEILLTNDSKRFHRPHWTRMK